MKKPENQSTVVSNHPKGTSSVGFDKIKKANPCKSCEAPCCKMLLIPYQPPKTFMDLDYIKYMLGFSGINMILYHNGTWQVQVEQNCDHLNLKTNLCNVHDSPDKPKTCSFFNPYNCFYKRNFSGNYPRNVIKIDASVFNKLSKQIQFDELGNIVSIPPLEVIEQIVSGQLNVS